MLVSLHFSPPRPERAQRFMYYNDLYKTAEFITTSRMLSLVKTGSGRNFFNMNQLCVLGALGGEISGLADVAFDKACVDSAPGVLAVR